jgi:hypothetical protein
MHFLSKTKYIDAALGHIDRQTSHEGWEKCEGITRNVYVT